MLLSEGSMNFNLGIETEPTSHQTENYVSPAPTYGLFFCGRKYDFFFLTSYPQPKRWWILGICENKLNPSYLFPK